jgi:ssDNA-binding Zn-finger/Zn-ribbon topoisomerase 1
VSDDDDREVFGPVDAQSAMQAMDADRLARVVGQAEARAKQVLASLRICAKCGKTMLPWPGRTTHFTCDPELPLVGRRCTCAPDCSDTHWGNGRVACDPLCEPCKLLRGNPLHKKRRG